MEFNEKFLAVLQIVFLCNSRTISRSQWSLMYRNATIVSQETVRHLE